MSSINLNSTDSFSSRHIGPNENEKAKKILTNKKPNTVQWSENSQSKDLNNLVLGDSFL